MWIFPLVLLIIFESVADIFAKEWSLKSKPIFWICAIAAYIVANSFWLWAIHSGSGLARGATIFSIASAILAIIIGLIFYKESITSIQFIGMLVGIVAIVLIFWNDLINI